MDVRTLLVIFLRLLSIVFLVSGLENWAILLGPLAPDGDFFALPVRGMVTVGFFAVVNLVAAVGLWLLASWGAVVWLISALTETVLHSAFRDEFGFEPVLIGFHATTVVVYVVLTLLYERTRDR